MHSDPGRVDVIHDKVRKLLKDSSDNAGYLHRPLGKSERYTIPLYTAPQPTEQQPAPGVTQLVDALESLIKGYVGLLEAGKDRITSLGGDCDPVPVMEKNDPWLRGARAALAAYRKQGGD